MIIPDIGITDELHQERGDPAGQQIFRPVTAIHGPGLAVLGGPHDFLPIHQI